MNETIQCSVCALHPYFESTLKEIKGELSSIDCSIKSLSAMFAEITIGKNDREQIRKSLDQILSEYKEINTIINDLRIEKEHIVARAQIEHADMKRDIDAAHEVVRNLIVGNDKKFDEIMKEMSSIKKEISKISLMRKIIVYMAATIGGIVGAIFTAITSTAIGEWIKGLF
jgi:hypothetical protein